MRKQLLALIILATLMTSCATGTQATLRGPAGPTIAAAQQQPANGKKARIAVVKFIDKSAKGAGHLGSGLADMLTTGLFRTNRYILLDRQDLDAIINEQDFAATGRISEQTAAKIGEIEGVDLLFLRFSRRLVLRFYRRCRF